ncbi:MAG: Na+/H+ antiporter NhaC [Bacteroidales bacterium]|nr:Na+/H+ antiporter NhaC [Bacteroidales bacterium]
MVRKPGFFVAVIPLIVLILFLVLNVFVFEDVLDGPNQIALLLASFVAIVVSFSLGFSWEAINHRIMRTIGAAMPSMLILLLIGSLAGTWLISGVVPAMVFYGLEILNPKIFLFATVVVCCVVSLVTGSSWSTVATIGVALLGIGKTLGFSEPIIAGAIISGAYFGDKMSPLSDTTNLAPAMAGTDIFTHIRYMTITTVPTLLITLGIFLVLGFTYDYSAASIDNSLVKSAISSEFVISPWLFLVPVLLFTIIILKVPAIPALLIGTMLGGLFALFFQPSIVETIAGTDGSVSIRAYKGVMQAMYGDVAIVTDHAMVNELLQTSGMRGMLNTVWLILTAMVFGGVMEAGGLLERITEPVLRWAKSTGSLVASTVFTCIFFNATASDQYISIVVPGRMFKDSFARKKLKPELLSRTLEDAGTVTSVLVPWNTCGATQAKVLGVATFDYLPYCFFNLISPLMSILVAFLNIKIRRIEEPEPMDNADKSEVSNAK